MDRRHRERYVFSTPAVIESGGVRSCGALLDVSVSGLRIRLASRPFLEPICVITAAAFGVRVLGRVVWRHGCEIGLQLLPGATAMPMPDGFGRRPPLA